MSTVAALFAGLPVQIEGSDIAVSELACDSRRVTAGACFAALPGARADGHAFVAQALERGATSVLCERDVPTPGATRIRTSDARRVFAEVARRFFADPAQSLCMVGVTGTNGKTTTTHLVQAVLDAANKPAGIIGTLGYRFGEHAAETGLTTPESLDLVRLLNDMKSWGAKAVAMEVSSHALSQHRVAGVDYDVGLFTNLTHDHLDYHGTFEAYFEAKAMLFRERLKPTGIGLVNHDDAWAQKLIGPRVLSFSLSGNPAATLRVTRLDLQPQGLALTIATPRGTFEVKAPLLGRFNAENVLSAVAVGYALELSPQVIASGLSHVSQVPGRLERVNQPGQSLTVVDYAHSPDALDKALAAMRELTRGKLWCVFGCGGDRDPHKRSVMGEVAATRADFTMVTSDNPRSEDPALIARAICQGLDGKGLRRGALGEKGAYAVELDRAAAIAAVVAAAKPEDTVLIAGKGHETYQIIGKETRHFDDREEARAALGAKS